MNKKDKVLIKALRREIRQLKNKNSELESQCHQSLQIAEALQAQESTARRVLAMAQYLLRVAGQFDAESKALLGIAAKGGRGP